jgi:hypothetical protein
MLIRWKRRTSLSVGAVITAFALVFLFVVPLVSYSVLVPVPFNYKPGADSCNLIKVSNSTLEAEYQRCLAKYLYPPAVMTSSSTIAYKLLGLGAPPYPREKLVTQGNDSALVYFKGASIEAAENFQVPITSLNPTGLATVENASLYLDENDFLQFSAVVVNDSPQPITLSVRIQGSGAFSTNATINGITWIGGLSVGCPSILGSKSECTASTLYPSTSTGGNLTQFHFIVEVLGKVGGRWFLYQQQFLLPNPYNGQVNAEWVAAFMRAVNIARIGASLQEDKTLDDFAQLRFETSTSNFTIANYGFNEDYNKFFPTPGPSVGETTLFVEKYLPAQYASVLQQTAPGHWSVLTDPTYTKFGYFVGEGPTVIAREPCAVTEFPSAGANMTQYLASHGCAYDIVQGPWLIIEVGS